jgi:predicted ABC-type sugar transport system permease subunit
MLFVVVFVVFGLLAPRFFAMQAFETILKQASYIGIVAIGMTFVILTAGIDLSVGSTMYVSAAVAGLSHAEPQGAGLAGAARLPGRGACSLAVVNAFLITKAQDRPLYCHAGHDGGRQRGSGCSSHARSRFPSPTACCNWGRRGFWTWRRCRSSSLPSWP